MDNGIYALFDLYLLVALGISVWMTFKLEKRLKARFPNTRPYKWGYFVGCMGVASAPFALLCIIGTVAFANQWQDLLGGSIVSLWFCAQTVCGIFIIKRKGWAWVIYTILRGPLSWIINGIYARRRWHEFGQGAAGSKDTVAPGHTAGMRTE